MISTANLDAYMNANIKETIFFQDTNMLVNQSPRPPVRMAAVVPKYTPLLFTLLFLLFIDFVINAFSEFVVFSSIAMLVIYMSVEFSIFSIYFQFLKFPEIF